MHWKQAFQRFLSVIHKNNENIDFRLFAYVLPKICLGKNLDVCYSRRCKYLSFLQINFDTLLSIFYFAFLTKCTNNCIN